MIGAVYVRFERGANCKAWAGDGDKEEGVRVAIHDDYGEASERSRASTIRLSVLEIGGLHTLFTVPVMYIASSHTMYF